MEVARKVACQPVRNKFYFHHNSGTPLTQMGPAYPKVRVTLHALGKKNKKATLPSGQCARAPVVFSVGLKPRPSRVLRGGWEAESSRDHSSLRLLHGRSSQTGPESVAAQAQAQRAEAAVAAAAGQCKMAAALVAAVDGTAGPGTVGAAASRMTRGGERAAEPRRLPCL